VCEISWLALAPTAWALTNLEKMAMAVIGVEPAVKYSFVLKGMQTRRKDQYNAELTLSPRLYVKPLITPITAI